MKIPSACNSLDDVRREIDRIDEQAIALLSQRGEYVRTAARFKTSESHVAAPDRQSAMLAVRRQWAQREGLDPDFIERLYRLIVDHFIAREMDHWKSGD